MSSILRMKIKEIYELTENFPGAIHLIYVDNPFKIFIDFEKKMADDKKKMPYIEPVYRQRVCRRSE